MLNISYKSGRSLKNKNPDTIGTTIDRAKMGCIVDNSTNFNAYIYVSTPNPPSARENIHFLFLTIFLKENVFMFPKEYF